MKRIAVHSAPRSGSTWLGSIFDSHPGVVYKYQPLFSYALKGFITPTSTASEIDEFFERLAIVKDHFMDQQEAKRRGAVPEFSKTRNPEVVVYKEVRYHHILENLMSVHEDVKVVGLIRNPMATLCSWWKAPREFRSDLGWKLEEEWLEAPSKNQNRPEEYYGYLKWKEVALLFHKLQVNFDDRFYLLRYLDLLQDTEHVVEQLFRFCGLKVHPSTLDFIRLSKASDAADAYSVFRSKMSDNAWKGIVPDAIVEHIRADLSGTVLEAYLE